MSFEIQRLEITDLEPLQVPGTGLVAHWYSPSNPSARAERGIVVLPIQGGDYSISRTFAEFFATQGFQVLRVERRAEWLDPKVPLEGMRDLVLQYVADIRRMIDLWLSSGGAPTHPELGLFGVSMGTMTGVLLASQEPRIGKSVFCIGGAELADIIVEGRDKELDAWRDAMVGRYGGLAQFEALVRSEVGPIGLLPAASKIRPESVLFIGARFDRVVPWSANVRLWEGLGRPRRHVIPTGHYSSVLALPWLKRWATRFLDPAPR